MYKNRISRTTNNITPNSHPQFFIRRAEFAFDERVAFDESASALKNSLGRTEEFQRREHKARGE